MTMVTIAYVLFGATHTATVTLSTIAALDAVGFTYTTTTTHKGA